MRALLWIALAGCGRIGFDATASDAELGSYRDIVLADAPMAYYRLGDSDTVARDEIGLRDGMYRGGCTQGASSLLAGEPDPALQLDGTTCYVALPDAFNFAGTAPFTIELWASMNTIDRNQHLFTRQTRQGTGPDDGYAILESATGVYFERAIAAANLATPHVVIPVATTVYLAAVYDGASLVLYVDGVPGSARPDARAMPVFSFSALIGLSFIGYAWVDGTIDELVIYDHALAADRITAHHQRGLGQN